MPTSEGTNGELTVSVGVCGELTVSVRDLGARQ